MDTHKTKLVLQNILVVTTISVTLISTFCAASGVVRLDSMVEEAEDHLAYPSTANWYVCACP